jgi:hypothetical protein
MNAMMAPMAPATEWYRDEAAYYTHAPQMMAAGWRMGGQQFHPDGTCSVLWMPPGFAAPAAAPIYPQPAPISQQPLHAMRPIETLVKEWRSADEFSRETQRLARDGWVLVSQSAGVTRTAVAKNVRNTVLTLGLNRVTPGIGGVARKTTIVATYQRQR